MAEKINLPCDEAVGKLERDMDAVKQTFASYREFEAQLSKLPQHLAQWFMDTLKGTATKTPPTEIHDDKDKIPKEDATATLPSSKSLGGANHALNGKSLVGLSLPQQVVAVLRENGEPMHGAKIAEALEALNCVHTNSDLRAMVMGVLRKRPYLFYKVERGIYGLQESLPENEE
jgi:hypothetical protein